MIEGVADMIKAELSYNPYLLETLVKFNGQEPRINSLVEKFQEGSLQEWVRRIPDIFYDEMNGFDFELEFSGTELDYLDVVDAFRRKGISEKLVRVFHKNELDGRYEKSKLIDALLAWLKENRNRNFDFKDFQEKYADLFESSYVYIIFQGSQLQAVIKDKDISAEHVESIDELKDTDLRNTPILLYLTKENIGTFQKNLKYFMERDDVEHRQLFFLMHPALDSEKVERIIKDLGIAEPNIVSDIFDDSIKRYIEMYPVSQYIYSAVSLFRSIVDELSDLLQEESEKCAIANREIYARIDQYEDIIRRLKDAHHSFVNRDNMEIPESWNNIELELLNIISVWRKRKTKITDDHEAENAADEFEADVRRYYSQFLDRIVNDAKTSKDDLDTIYETWYRGAGFGADFQIANVEFTIPDFLRDVDIADDLKSIFNEEYVQPKEDIFGMFFKASSDTPKAPVRQRTYYYQDWRDRVMEILRPREEEVKEALFTSLKEYDRDVSKTYIEHLVGLIEEQTKLKDQEAAKLSDEERLLQNDMDWLVSVQDQLKVIERG